jgi:hypothetical protein
MKPLKQRNLHRPDEGVWGDCHRAAIASILELPLDDVPHFGDGGPDGEEFLRRESEFLLARGLVPIQVAYQTDDLAAVLNAVNAANPGVYYLLGGKSRTGVNHTVVCVDSAVVHDPSLNDSGIVGPCIDGLFWITYFGSALVLKKDAT